MLEPLKSKPEKKINLSLTEFVFPKTRSKKLTGVSIRLTYGWISLEWVERLMQVFDFNSKLKIP